MNWLRTLPIAHRGLHDAARGIIENSPSAFEAAVCAGYGIELDVRQSADGEAIVFHDRDLSRLTREEGPLRERSARELTQILLEGSADTIPTLGNVLDQIGGRVPVYIEIKNTSHRVGKLEARVASIVEGYQGEFAIASFNPYSLGWYAKNTPHIARGQISEGYRGDEETVRLALHERFLLRHLLLSPISRPHFIAYDYKALPALGPHFARTLGLPVLAWTVKDAGTWDRIKPYADNLIFEGFRPPLPEMAETHA